jgi:tripartite-type tricarboxylate transporter receptor subunit TctC
VTGSWQGILAPAKTPPEIVSNVNAEVARILKLPDVIQFLNSQGTTPLGNSPQDTRKWLADERVRWAKVVKDSGFKLEQ